MDQKMQSRDDHAWNGGDAHLDPQQGGAGAASGNRYAPYSRHNLPGSVSADSGHARDGAGHGADAITQGAPEDNMRDLALRDRQDKPKKEKSSRTCQKCGEGLTGQFVRALGGTFHLECFRCRDCGDIVASKFFPVDEEDGSGRQYPLCETDYFKRLDLLCFNCGGALRGSYVTALDRKYHIDHFTCSVCPTAFGAKDSYYEHESMVYCHYHYSTRFAQRCNGCQTAILKQFVEIFRNGQNQHWHPECYMIHKFWSVRLTPSKEPLPLEQHSEDNASDEERSRVREEEEKMEQKTFNIWSILSAFEEASAACISDMLLHVSNGAYVDGVLVAKKFINHVELLFTALDQLENYVVYHGQPGLSYGREAKLLCKRIVSFFTLLTKTQDTGVKRLGVTQELLSLVTGLAHYLKLLIRIGLQGALKYEREKSDIGGLDSFLDDLSHLETVAQAEVVLEDTASLKELASDQSDLCRFCQSPIDDECLLADGRRWHHRHLKCCSCGREVSTKEPNPPLWKRDDQQAYCGNCRQQAHNPSLIQIESVSRLQQYVYLLRIALARLLQVLRSGGTLPHTSDDPNLQQYDSNEGHRLMPTGQLASTSSRPDASRSKSYAGLGENASSFQQSVEDVKRQRSTRLGQRLSTTGRQARTSRILEGSNGTNLAGNPAFQVVEDGTDGSGPFGAALNLNEGTLTLDDIPRIVAAENAKSQRPNAAKYAGDDLLPKFTQPKRRSTGALQALGEAGERVIDRPKKYFSELSPMEYFIVRHIAVLQMEPLLRDHYNLEELLSLIETRKQTFWNKLFVKNDGKGKGSKKKGVFGAELTTLVETKGVDSTYGIGPSSLRVPALLDDAVSAMRGMDLSVEGVFRKNGNIKRLRELSEKLDSSDNVDLSKETPVQVAALLKKFLREMPDPILTHKLHDLWVTTQSIKDLDVKRRVLHLTCCLLPKPHRDSLEILFGFLNFAASFSHVDEESGSKMDIHNIATVIAPNVLIPPPTSAVGMDGSFRAVEAVHMLLTYLDEMCEVPEDIQSVLTDSELFQMGPEVTTKEILKRYGDITKRADVQKAAAYRPAEFGDVRSHEASNTGSAAERAAEGTAERIDNNPQQTKAWSKESSVRHVQGNGSGMPAPPFGRPSQSGSSPAQSQGDFGPSRPYHFRHGSGGSSRSQGQGGSGYGKQPMGVI